MSEQSPVVIISCKVLEHLLLKLLPPEVAKDAVYLDYALHSVPKKLTKAVQEQIDAVPQPSLIVLGYGLCGNGLHGVKAGPHTLLIPRTDDCIAMLLGSRKRYVEQFAAKPNAYYLSKGWLEGGSNPLIEYQGYVAKFGEETAMWLMDQQYQHYRHLILVTDNPEDMERYRPQALEVAKFCERWGMQYEELLGSDEFVRGLVAASAAPGQAGGDFLIIPPGGEILQSMFIDEM